MILVLLAIAGASSPEEDDATPLPRYVDAGQLHAVLVTGDWQSCLSEESADLTAPIHFSLMPTGRAEAIRIEGAEPALAACWSAQLAALHFPEHDEAPLSAHWTLGIHSGRAISYPVVQIDRREMLPLFLFISPDSSAEQRRILREELGLDAQGWSTTQSGG